MAGFLFKFFLKIFDIHNNTNIKTTHMKKDAFYFPHFSNARNDRKIRRMIKKQGLESYAVYFMILEVLREQDEFKYPMHDIDLLADEFNTTDDMVKNVIEDFGLFKLENGHFFSPRLNEYMTPYLEKKERARNASLKRWNKKGNANGDANAYANGNQMESSGNADLNPSKVKKSKVKKSKENESKVNIYKPSIELVEEHFYFSGKIPQGEIKKLSTKFMHYYDRTDWKDKDGEYIKNWKRLANGWIKKQFEQPTTTDKPF